jgi:hypothetical protein
MRTDGQMDRQTDRQTGVTKLLVACRNFANAPKNASVVTKSVRKAVIRPANTEHETHASQTLHRLYAHTLKQAKAF